MMNLKYFFLFVTLASCSFTFVSAEDSTNKQKAIEKIDIEIRSLREQLLQSRMKALNSEQNAQTYFRNHPEQFIEDIKLSEEDEKHILELKKHINELLKQKQTLLGTPNDS